MSEVCFKEEQDIRNTCEKLRKSQSVSEWSRCGKWGAMHTNLEYLSWREVEVLGYFQLLDMKYDDGNAVSKIVSTRFLQLYLIWTPAQILEHVKEFQTQI